MTKSAQIKQLYDGVRTTREIADIVGCRPEYVRVVARQRQGNGISEIDKRYMSSPLGQHAISKRYPRKRAYIRALRRILARTGNAALAKTEGRKAYALARATGATRQEAKDRYNRECENVLGKTGNRMLARKSARAAYHRAKLEAVS